MSGIQRSRGCIIRTHRKGGFRVVMYHDQPGDYFDERGLPLSDDVAKAAGYDVVKYAREKEKLSKLSTYKRVLDAEYASAEEAIAQAMSDGDNVVARHVGGGQYLLFDPDGNKLLKKPVNREEAALLIGEFGTFDEGGEDGNKTKRTTKATKKAADADADAE